MLADHADAARQLDAQAVQAVLGRLVRAQAPPWLHGEIARRMAQRLAAIRLRPEVVLDWWGFLGAGAALLEQAYPAARRIAVEPTPALVERSRHQVQRPWWSAQRWRNAAPRVMAEDAELPSGVQLVWANMMLHAVLDPPALFERWQRALSVDGFVMFSCLGPGTLRELRSLYGRLGWPSPTPGFIDMHDLGDMLLQAGFADPVMDQEVITLSWETPQAVLAELRSLGGNASPQRWAGWRTPRWRARLLAELASLAGPDGRIVLSFEVAYGHAFKAAPRARPGEVTAVSLQDMRAMVRGRKPAALR